MIASFKDRRLKRFYETGDRSRIAPEQVEKIENILARLDAAGSADDMDLPGFRLHPLRGDLRGFWSVTVRANWRVIFRFEDGAALDVELVDYHQRGERPWRCAILPIPAAWSARSAWSRWG